MKKIGGGGEMMKKVRTFGFCTWAEIALTIAVMAASCNSATPASGDVESLAMASNALLGLIIKTIIKTIKNH